MQVKRKVEIKMNAIIIWLIVRPKLSFSVFGLTVKVISEFSFLKCKTKPLNRFHVIVIIMGRLVINNEHYKYFFFVTQTF